MINRLSIIMFIDVKNSVHHVFIIIHNSWPSVCQPLSALTNRYQSRANAWSRIIESWWSAVLSKHWWQSCKIMTTNYTGGNRQLFRIHCLRTTQSLGKQLLIVANDSHFTAIISYILLTCGASIAFWASTIQLGVFTNGVLPRWLGTHHARISLSIYQTLLTMVDHDLQLSTLINHNFQPS